MRRSALYAVSSLAALGACKPATPATAPVLCESPASGAPDIPAPIAADADACTCCDGPALDRTPPKIRRAGLANPAVIELVFSERIVAPTHVDPRQFRISLGMGYAYEGYASSYYTDPCSYGDGCRSGSLAVRRLSLSDNAKRLFLELSDPLPADLCSNIREYQREMLLGRIASGLKMSGSLGLYVHYTSAGTEPIRDASGNELQDIGAHWALAQGAEYSYQYAVGNAGDPFRGLIPLPCTLRE